MGILNFILVLLVSLSSCEEQPRWTAYTDMMTAICANFKESELRTQKRVLAACFTVQKNYLHCVSAQPAGSPIAALNIDGKDFYRHTLPCGWKEMNPTLHLFRTTVFSIVVKSSFHINVTFPHFELPTSRRQVFSFESFEYVRLTKRHDPFARGTLLLGRRAPFWVKWAHNRLFVMHGGIEGYPRAGSFILQYQVCEPERKALIINVLTRSNSYRYAKSSIAVTLKGMPFWSMSQSTAFYSFHIIGSKTKALDLAIGKQHSYKGFLKAVTFEAPDPAEPYIHPDSHFLVQGSWIYFVTFQGYLQLWCATMECPKLSVSYTWPFTVYYVRFLTSSQKLHFPSAECNGNKFLGRPDSLLYCNYVFVSHEKKRLHVSLEDLQFKGFDFIGNYSSDHTCLLAGITMIDMARYNLLMEPERYESETGQPLEEDFVNNIFPEVTICNIAPYMRNVTTTKYKLPMADFITTTSRLFVIVYGYGHHLDLKNSRLSIRVSATSKIGLLLSCPLVNKDRFMQYSIRHDTFSHDMRSDIVALTKTDNCGKDSFMLYYSIAIDTAADLSVNIRYCSSWHEVTKIKIAAPVGWAELQDQPLVIQDYYDPASFNALECFILENDIMMRLTHNYDIEAHVSQSIHCIQAASILSTLFQVIAFVNSEIKTLDPNESTSINYLMYNVSAVKLQIYMFSSCVKIKIVVSGTCQKLGLRNTQELSMATARQSLSHRHLLSMCKSYQLPDTWNKTLEFLVPQNFGMDIFKNTVDHEIHIDQLTANVLNNEIPRYQLSLTLTANRCRDLCKQFELSIAYEEAVTGQLIWLQWDVYMGESKTLSITITQIPLTDWVVYVTRIGNFPKYKLPCSSQPDQCVPIIEFDTFFEHASSENINMSFVGHGSEHVPEAHLIFIWTQEPHTWEEAELMCSTHEMHLVSLTSEAEYLILLDLLLGESQHGGDIAILTPCKLDTPLCAIYIGMQTKDGNISWTDDVPTGFLRWKAFHLGRPHFTRQELPDQYVIWKNIFSEKRKSVQPICSDKTMCTALLGYPSPRQMEYVSVPCDLKLPMAGVVCMQRKVSKLEQQVYGLTHMMVDTLSHSSFNDIIDITARPDNSNSSSSSSSSNNINNNINTRLFNLQRFNISVLNASNVQLYRELERITTPSDLLYYEQFSQTQYQEISDTFQKAYKWPWTETVTKCNRSVCGITMNQSTNVCPHTNMCGCLLQICSKFGARTSLTGTVRILTKYIMIPISHGVYAPSITLTGNELTALKACGTEWIFLSGQCVKLVRSPSRENLINNMLLLCNTSGYKVFTSPNSNEKFAEYFKIWDFGKQLVAFINSSRICVVYGFNGYSTCQDQKQRDQAPLVLCSKAVRRTKCPVGYNICSNQCVSELTWCDGQIDCQDAADEKACTHICSAAFATNITFCLKNCHRGNCTCNALFFQCESGGCLNSGRLCDGIFDCVDGSDEHFCPQQSVLRSNPTDQSHVKTCFTAMNMSSEAHSNELLEMNSLYSATKCDPTSELPCLHWNPVCYPVDKRCVYDHTSEGHLKYCSNGHHLNGCEEFQCSDTYKCTQSYCVPAHKICDGIIDCPHRDDEMSCPIQTCVNMLHCGTRCVHPNEICDGEIHCADGTDEQFCQPPQCPNLCDCLGHSVHCVGSDVGRISSLTGIVKIAVIRSNHHLVLDDVVFRYALFVLFLDLSHNSLDGVGSLCTFPGLGTMVKLNIANNTISFLGRNSFLCLSNLRELDLSRNPLVKVHELTFAGLKNLTFLHLHHTKLVYLSAEAFGSFAYIQVLDVSSSGLQKLHHFCLGDISVETLDIRSNFLKSSQPGSSWCLRHVSNVLSDQKGVCCLNAIRGKCSSTHRHSVDCKTLLSNRAYVICVYILTVCVILCNSVSLMFNIHVKSPDSALVANLAFANIFMALPLYAVTQWHSDYGTAISFHETFLGERLWCRTSGVLLLMSTHIGSMLILLITAIKCHGVLSLTTGRVNSVQTYMNIAVLCLWAFWIGLWVAFALMDILPIHEVSECLLGQRKNGVIRSFIIICGVSNMMCCLFCVTLIAFIVRAVLRSAHLAGGRKHGGVQFTPIVIKLLATAVVTVLALVPPSILLLLWTFHIDWTGRTMVNMAVVMFAIQPVTNPIVYTLSTGRFESSLRRIL